MVSLECLARMKVADKAQFGSLLSYGLGHINSHLKSYKVTQVRQQ